MHPLFIQRVHCIKISVFSHIRTPILIQSWGAFSCLKNVLNSRKTDNRKTITSQYSLKTRWKAEKCRKWGVKGKTIEKAIVFFLALFSIEGCILEKQRRYEENGTLTAWEIALPCGWQISRTMLISFIMYRVQVQPSRKHKYSNYSTKKGLRQPCENLSSHSCRSP